MVGVIGLEPNRISPRRCVGVPTPRAGCPCHSSRTLVASSCGALRGVWAPQELGLLDLPVEPEFLEHLQFGKDVARKVDVEEAGEDVGVVDDQGNPIGTQTVVHCSPTASLSHPQVNIKNESEPCRPGCRRQPLATHLRTGLPMWPH